MKRGHFELVIDKIIVFGVAGSGKTCTVHVLVGLAPPKPRNSTPLMKRPVTVLFVSVDDEKQWKIRTLEEMRDTVAEVIKSRMPQQQAEARSDAGPASPGQQSSHTTASQSPQPTPEKTSTSTPKVAEKSTPSLEKKPTGVQSEEGKVSLSSLLQSSEVDEGFVSLINSCPPSLMPILRLRQVVLLDSGGQPQLQEVLPVFLNGASKFMYVHKLHESLEERPTIRYVIKDEVVSEYRASQTNADTLKLCTRTMSSMSCKNPDLSPSKLLFLATHRDMVADKQLDGVLDTLYKKLREILLPRFKDQIIYCNEKGEEFVFTLNAAKPEKMDKECGEAIRECLNKEVEGRPVVKVPLRWHALYQTLVEVMEGWEKKVLSREQCRQVAESMKIEEESCEEALEFFNRLNVLFYFPEHLPELVFVDPQIVLDKVTELVEESYRMIQGTTLRATPGERLKFREYGQVTEEFLSEFKSHYEPPLFTAKELIKLFKGLLVFADLSEGVYFMPCLLQVVKSEVVSQYRDSGERALTLHFPDSGPLLGMFCSTVAYLLSPENSHPCPWKVVTKEAGTPKCLKRNVIKFSVGRFPGTVSLIDHFTHFEIHVHTHPKKASQLWQLAHDAVFAGLRKAGKTIGYKNNTPVPAIVCPAHPTTPHPATVDKDQVWLCTEDKEEFGDVDITAIPWWTVCMPDCEPTCIVYTLHRSMCNCCIPCTYTVYMDTYRTVVCLDNSVRVLLCV